MKTISDLIEEAADGAHNDSAINGDEAALLKKLAAILRDEKAEDLDNLKERLAHYCE